MLTLGLISDTHGRLRAAASEALRGVGEILHAGDVGTLQVAIELEQIAPTVLVAGNTDQPGHWPAQRLLEREGHRILLLHDIGRVFEPSPDMQRRARSARVDLVVFGHSHAPADYRVGPVRYVNPGAAGPPRGAPPTVARMRLDGDAVELEHLIVG